MKIRNGFVSNSSSSSFIIGIAKVADEKRLKQILKKVPKEDKANYVVGTFDEIAQSPLISRLYRLTTKFDSKTGKFNTKDRLNKIVIEAPVNTCETVAIEANGWNQNELVKYVKDKNGDVWAKSTKKPALWFAVCVGNDEGDGGPDSPFYQWTFWQKVQYYLIAIPLNWMSRYLLYPIIKVLNKIFKKNWFYPYMIITAKSGYEKVKDHKFFKKEWQREIVKAFEEAEKSGRYMNEGIFSDEYECHTYKIGAERNG